MQESVRDALVAYVLNDFEAAYPGVPLVTDNAPFDWNKLPDRFVTFEVRWSPGNQIGPAAEPKTRMKGHVYATAYVREGLGSKKALNVMDWFAGKLKYQHVGLANLQAPEPRDVPPTRGFYLEQLAIYFYSDPT